MSNEKTDQYGVEPPKQPTSGPGDALPTEKPPAPPPPPDMPPDMKPPVPRPFPIELELEPVEPAAGSAAPVGGGQRSAKPSVKDLDVCPNCGASMTGPDSLVCVRCGFDLKTMKVVKTVTGETTAVPSGQADDVDGEERPILVQPGLGDLWLPAAMAAIGGLIMLICYLAGARGLFPQMKAIAEIGLVDRIEGFVKFLVLTAVCAACGLGALAFMAYLLGMKLVNEVADIKLAAVRMLGIVTTMSLTALIDLKYWTLEFIAESILKLAIFMGLSILLFKLKPRDGLTLAGISLILFVLLWVGTFIVQWATTGVAVQS